MLPKKMIQNEQQLENLLSQPTQEVVDVMTRLAGDFILLGIAGKIGPSLARMLKQACEMANSKRRIIGVSRFSNENLGKALEAEGFEIIKGDLLNPDFIKSLPKVKNVIFLAAMKFGSEENLPLTWAVNTYLPALVAEHFKDSKIVAFSTGCVYELVPVASGGSLETDIPNSIGEYAQSCLGRERMFEYGSKKYQTEVVLIRLNYAVELRYGVLVDIAFKVWNEKTIDLTMGHFNVIWQGDANEMVIRAFENCESPAKILNITGADTLSVRQVAKRFGELFEKEINFSGKEAETALLSNAQEAFKLFGKPKTDIDQVIIWIAEWVKKGNKNLNKPTHFEVRDGKY